MYTKYAAYRDTKKKVPSLRESKPSNMPLPLGLDLNFRDFQFGRHSISYDDFMETCGKNFQSCLVSEEDLRNQTTVGCAWTVLKPVEIRYNMSRSYTHDYNRDSIVHSSRKTLHFGSMLAEQMYVITLVRKLKSVCSSCFYVQSMKHRLIQKRKRCWFA